MLKKGLDYSMNKYVKDFLHIGLIFSGLGPIVLGIVYMIINASGVEVILSAGDVFKAILTTYVIAFVQAGISVFPKIESWSSFKVMLMQGLCCYLVYVIGYLINSWIPFNFLTIVIFTGVFITVFVCIWIAIFTIAKKVENKMNAKLKEINKD